jgi:hypothetical protein
LELRFTWPEQGECERIESLVHFGESVPERTRQTESSERTLYRRIAGFEEDGTARTAYLGYRLALACTRGYGGEGR